MAESKKALVAFDPERPDKSSSDFLIPVRINLDEIRFLGTRSGTTVRYGMTVLTSRAITENDLFAKLVDTGQKITNVADTLQVLARFLDAMKSVKIGNIVELGGASSDTISLLIVANTPSGFAKYDLNNERQN
ncbi:MAG: hypothetical protein KJ000_36255 [Pirellulaceae bacterium]|nr:hypothetical protein [Pirellulaceae bacterium]